MMIPLSTAPFMPGGRAAICDRDHETEALAGRPVVPSLAARVRRQHAEPLHCVLLTVEIDHEIRAQSTLIAYKSDRETGRSVGDTNRVSIAALLDASL
jgi:hypothetical protein